MKLKSLLLSTSLTLGCAGTLPPVPEPVYIQAPVYTDDEGAEEMYLEPIDEVVRRSMGSYDSVSCHYRSFSVNAHRRGEQVGYVIVMEDGLRSMSIYPNGNNEPEIRYCIGRPNFRECIVTDTATDSLHDLAANIMVRSFTIPCTGNAPHQTLELEAEL